MLELETQKVEYSLLNKNDTTVFFETGCFEIQHLLWKLHLNDLPKFLLLCPFTLLFYHQYLNCRNYRTKVRIKKYVKVKSKDFIVLRVLN